MNTKLDEAVRNTPPPPCVGCEFAAICRDYWMACSSFEWYIGHGDKGGYTHRPMGADELPTDAMYMECFPEEDRPGKASKFLGAGCA